MRYAREPKKDEKNVKIISGHIWSGLSGHHLELETEPVGLDQSEGDEVKGYTVYSCVRKNYKHDVVLGKGQ